MSSPKKHLQRFCSALFLATSGLWEICGGIVAFGGMLYAVLAEKKNEYGEMMLALLTAFIGVILLFVRTGYKMLALEDRMRPVLKLESGGRTTGRKRPVPARHMTYDFFGVWITNLGAQTVENFELRLMGVEKNGAPIEGMGTSGLTFEPTNPFGDFPKIDLKQHVTERSAICSVNQHEEVEIGACNFNWRHGPTAELFRDPANYTFIVQMIGRDFETRVERFVFRWTGRRADSDIRRASEVPREWATPPSKPSLSPISIAGH